MHAPGHLACDSDRPRVPTELPGLSRYLLPELGDVLCQRASVPGLLYGLRPRLTHEGESLACGLEVPCGFHPSGCSGSAGRV
jgi:hypothetical protein